MLERIESTMAAIRTRLSRDSLINKLLTYDGKDVLEAEVPFIKPEEMDKYITLRPIFEFENKKNYDQNSIINIYSTEFTPLDDVSACVGVLQINVVCNLDVWELDNNKIRPLQLAQRIVDLVNNKKFTISNKIVLSNISDLIISKKMVGYALLFELTDGSGEK